jgi:hypothetical protein
MGLVGLLIPFAHALALPPNATTLQPTAVSTTTGEKPQSKTWTHGGYWWCVLPNTTGTWLKRLDGTAWTDVLKLSNATNSKADVKTVGDVAHVLLFEGDRLRASSRSSSFQPPIPINRGVSGPPPRRWPWTAVVEIASLDIDSQGRMWVASDGATTVAVRYGDPPYAS